MKGKERLEEGLYALLKMAWETENDFMSDIITDLLMGYEISEQYKGLSKEGKEEFIEAYE